MIAVRWVFIIEIWYWPVMRGHDRDKGRLGEARVDGYSAAVMAASWVRACARSQSVM